MESSGITRREALGRAALAAAAATLPFPALVDAATRRRTRSVHCLRASDRFAVARVLGDCSSAAFSPDGTMLACTTPRGVEVRRRDGSESRIVTPEGFRVAGSAWHADGRILLASGPGGVLAPAEAPFAVRSDGSGMTRLLDDLPGASRALTFSPDGRRIALTYLDGFVHRMLLADFEQGDEPRMVSPRVLLPFDPANEQSTSRMAHGLSWYETRGFTPDGSGLVFSSDRAGGMLNANVYVLDLESGRIRHVTHDDGFTEGAVVDHGGVLFYGSTRAREHSFLTLVTGPQIPPFLGFAAAPALHDALGRGHAPVGNGDVLAADARTGLRARIVARRETLALAAALGPGEGDHRIRVCSISPEGTELAVAVSAGGRDAVVMLRRESVPPRVSPRATPVPPTAAPFPGPRGGGGLVLFPEEPVPIVRTLRGRYGGSVELRMNGNLQSGSFRARFDGFADDGVAAFDGSLTFEAGGGGFDHEADLRRLRGSDAGDDSASGRGFYRASVTIERPETSGSMESRWPRSGGVKAVAVNGVFVPDGKWAAGRKRATGVAGAERCPKPRRRRRRRRASRRRRKR